MNRYIIGALFVGSVAVGCTGDEAAVADPSKKPSEYGLTNEHEYVGSESATVSTERNCGYNGCPPHISEDLSEVTSLSSDITCGDGGYRVRHAGGSHLNPESCAWLPRRGLFACTESGSTVGGSRVPDYFGWISFFTPDGTPWYPVGGFGGPSGWEKSNEWNAQCGSLYLSNPLGIAALDEPDSDAPTRLYVVEAGAADDGTQSVWAFDLVPDPADPAAEYCQPFNIAHLPTRTLNDVARAPSGDLYVTESAFGAASQSAIWKIGGIDGASAPTVSKWLSLSSYPAPNPIEYVEYDLDGNGVREPFLFVATLGSNLDPTSPPHNGRLLRIPVTGSGAPGTVTAFGPSGLFDGLAWRPSFSGTGTLVLADLNTRVVQSVHPRTGAASQTLDLSDDLPQLGGVECGGLITDPVCAVAGYRDSQVVVFER